ncbi:sensor histidine kinase [Bacillus atrophaeus]|uniref:sensor histidine kinase n=1 Tax=Bacillus atrophaeus TaxID=1452 RepID=UPI00123A2801|nr:HAMP domain-containing sensor histidine kinase [Bacillus atrophaeus]KAA6450016.1 sensor histidine kinase [Bacillus atrophaeus]
MKLRNRVAFYFVSRLFLLMLIWGLLIVISTLLFSFFLGQNKTETPHLSIRKVVNHTVVADKQLSIKSQTKEDLIKNRMWIQILDEQGDEIFSFNKPKHIPDHYILGELVSDYLYPSKKGYQLSTWYETKDNQDLTWVLGKPMVSNNPFLYWMNNLWIFSIIIIGVVIALFFGKQLGAPLLYMVSWIENLSKGKYEEPSYSWKFRSKKHRRKRTEYKTYEELMQALSDLTSTLQKNTVERELLENTREEWMEGVSHDLKTPLSVIKGYTVLLSSNEYDWEQEKVRHFAKTMEERVQYMEQLIEDFSLTFQLKNEALPLEREEKNVVEILRNIVEEFKISPTSENKILSFETKHNVVLFNIDERYLKRAIENVIGNCIKHNPSDTKIKVIIQKEISLQNKIQIVIEDDGIGMEQETVEHLFDRYFRGISTSANNLGTGLGMAIAKQIIIAHGGTIDVYSKPQLGTKFTITFPAPE